METTSGNNMGNYEDIQVELTYIYIPNPPFCSSRPAFGQHNPVYVPAPGPARQAEAGGPASSSPPDELTAAAQFVAQNPQLSVRMLTYTSMYVYVQTISGYDGLNCKAACDRYSSRRNPNWNHSNLMAPNNMPAEVSYYTSGVFYLPLPWCKPGGIRHSSSSCWLTT